MTTAMEAAGKATPRRARRSQILLTLLLTLFLVYTFIPPHPAKARCDT